MTLCPLCRAFSRFALRVEEIKETPDRAEWEKLFTAGCWVIAALERTHPCSAHPRTLRQARRLAEELVGLVEEEKEGMALTTLMASKVTGRKEIRQ